ncbi:hypothetical protein PENCOP_c002G02781 [Penicillium coprophilum]|uniref:non-specific serine/threonine protein kinase n=1 Tax=Penicillium coprophilum TaxID=36646 RepID=A0A1V6V0W8_9EURO|nr:hypothetical protein PENCOP_c002G02781 [Penicillium coprophilum]
MSTSSPPTPLPRGPVDDELKSKAITSPCELVEDYCPGGYHPVALGDVFDDQYKVIRKLGEGSYAAVWLAHDLRNSGYVALKILVSEISGSTSKIRTLRHIVKVTPVKGARHITHC